MKSKIFISLTISIFCLINAQSVSDLNEMMNLYEKYKNTSTSSLNNAASTITNTDKVSNQLHAKYLLNNNKYKNGGKWNSRDDYRLWLEETGGDKSVRELYGYTLDESPYFGYDIFTKRDSIAIWPNVSIPDYYVIGPGDNIEVALWGQAQIMSVLTIDQEGYLFDPNIGKVYLEGKTLKETRNVLKNLYSKKYSSLKGDDPSTFISITITGLKSINVHFTGNVNFPGLHILNPLSTIITGLYQAGGIDTLGTLRKVQLIRNGSVINEIDIYDYLLKGDIKSEYLLQNNDVVNVQKRGDFVKIDGQVLNAGIYESKEGESLYDILSYAGGPKSDASIILLLSRTIPINARKFDKPSYQNINIKYEDLDEIICQDGDELIIGSAPKISNYVTVSGKIKNPGRYVLTNDLTLKELLIHAGGIEDPEFLKSAYLDEIEILRVDNSKDEDEVIKFSYHDIINTNEYDDFKLMKDDHVIIRENIYYRTNNLVEISGEVMVPGVYPIVKDNQSLERIIQKAGGFTNLAFMDGIEIFRGDKRLVWQNFNVPLISGDKVIVPQKPGVVEVRGEVNNPGLIYYSKGKSLGSYIRSAGGFTVNGKKSNVSIIYPNGNVKKRGMLPKNIVEGCVIEIHKKAERDAISLLTVVEQSVSIISSLALTYIAVQATK